MIPTASEINGGTLLDDGPSSDGDGAFDYDGEATISGGTVLMAGAVGMAQSFTSGTQAFALVRASGSAGNVIEATDADGNVIATLTATRAFGCVLVSGAGISDGDTITVSVDGAATMATASTTGTSGIATAAWAAAPRRAIAPRVKAALLKMRRISRPCFSSFLCSCAAPSFLASRFSSTLRCVGRGIP